MTYSERLRVPLSWWLLAAAFVAALWLALVVALPGPVVWAVTALAVAVAAGLLLGYGGLRVSVGTAGLRVGRALLEWSACGAVESLDAAAARRLRGVDADARAYLATRPYITGGVRVEVVDDADPTPYWLVSSRHPERLAAAVDAARRAAGHAP